MYLEKVSIVYEILTGESGIICCVRLLRVKLAAFQNISTRKMAIPKRLKRPTISLLKNSYNGFGLTDDIAKMLQFWTA